MKCSIWPAQTHGAEPKRTVTRMKRARAVVFVARCAGAATAAYGAAHLPGLPEALWATMSAIIVTLCLLILPQMPFTKSTEDFVHPVGYGCPGVSRR